MLQSAKKTLEFSSKSVLDLAGHLKDAFLHTEIPVQVDSMIPKDTVFIEMARYLDENFSLFPLIKKESKNVET